MFLCSYCFPSRNKGYYYFIPHAAHILLWIYYSFRQGTIQLSRVATLDPMIESIFIYLTCSPVFDSIYLQSQTSSFITWSGEKMSSTTDISQAPLEDTFCSGNMFIRISNNIIYVLEFPEFKLQDQQLVFMETWKKTYGPSI